MDYGDVNSQLKSRGVFSGRSNKDYSNRIREYLDSRKTELAKISGRLIEARNSKYLDFSKPEHRIAYGKWERGLSEELLKGEEFRKFADGIEINPLGILFGVSMEKIQKGRRIIGEEYGKVIE